MPPLATTLNALADFALPPRCPGCGAVTDGGHRFCATCWGSLRFLGPPWCATCALPFDHDRGEGAQCAACMADPPRHAGVRAAVAYGDISRNLALRLKYGGKTGHAETAARLMRPLMPVGATLLVPVPLHRWRIWSRGFNQAALIAGALSRRSGVACDPSLLIRQRATPLLRGKGRKERARIVQGVFAATRKLNGEAVVLVDDIHTSGATTGACTRALLKAGADSVTILCWARVLGDEGSGHWGD